MRASFFGTLNSGALMNNLALRFDASKAHHVNHGAFWLKDVAYTSFYWDAFVRPTEPNSTGYLISAGYGPSHCLLWGFSSSDTHVAITGNIWNGSDITSFSSPQIIPLGDWVHTAVCWDLSQILTYINGTAEGRTAYAAATRSTPNGYDANLYVGGSDHLNGGFDLKWIRGFEGTVPIPNVDYRTAYRPERYPRAYYKDGTSENIASFFVDYSTPGEVIADISGGFPTGHTHPGARQQGIDGGGFFDSVQSPFVSLEADLPQWVAATINGPTIATTSVPVGAKIHDDFNRDASFFWKNNADVALGSTEGGSQGILAWQGSPSSYGISYGRAFYKAVGEGTACYVSAGTDDVDINVVRTGGMTVYARYTDANNYVSVQTQPQGDGTDWVTIAKSVAGSVTTYQAASGGANSSDSPIRLVVSGNTITVYINGIQKYTGGSSLPSGNNVGFQLGSGYLAKLDTFTVY